MHDPSGPTARHTNSLFKIQLGICSPARFVERNWFRTMERRIRSDRRALHLR